MPIILARHGQAISNNGENCIFKISDENVWLTQKGRDQAHNAGAWLNNYLCKHYDKQDDKQDDPILWVSTSKRTRQTAGIINSHLKIPKSHIKYSDYLTEQALITWSITLMPRRLLTTNEYIIFYFESITLLKIN